MDKLYIVTGANGHLGNTILRLLSATNAIVRGLLLPGEQPEAVGEIAYFYGDVRDFASLAPLFAEADAYETVVFHTAGIVDISETVSPAMYEVNVNGTKNILAQCVKNQVKRLVYVSSVHAIPEGNPLTVLKEVDQFSADWVTGGYAKTKAAATQAVLDAAKSGLDAVVVQPSGILGPFDYTRNHLVQLLDDYLHGRLPACVNGGYDFVDVRDVAAGCLAAAKVGKTGECYILSNRHYEIKDVLSMAKTVTQGKNLPVLPMWMARAALPLMGLFAKIKKSRPLYTKYSLYTLKSNDRFSHDKATRDLRYAPRDLLETIQDTVLWLNRKQARATVRQGR